MSVLTLKYQLQVSLYICNLQGWAEPIAAFNLWTACYWNIQSVMKVLLYGVWPSNQSHMTVSKILSL